MIYNTIEFLHDLKKEAQRLMTGTIITNNLMSELLTGQKGRHYESKKTLVVQYAKNGKIYLIAEDVLEGYMAKLRNYFKHRYRQSNFNWIFKQYCEANTLKKFAISTLNYNPNLNLDYFDIIDSKEKAYWLGWFFAEGHITKRGGVQIEIGLKDEILVLRFAKAIGFELSNINYKKRNRDDGSETTTVLITFQDSCFVGHLLNKELVRGKKSDVIALPDLGDIHNERVREFYMAFLLGYFDGDGGEGSSRIYSNSYEFLYQIKKKFKINSKISEQKYKTKDGDEKTKYTMSLTADLFNEMLCNYNFSLGRKRIKLVDSKLRAEQLERARAMRREKFMFSKEELQTLLFKMPKIKIAKLHLKKFDIEIGRTSVDRYARKWGLKMPPAYYWNGKIFLGNLDDYL